MANRELYPSLEDTQPMGFAEHLAAFSDGDLQPPAKPVPEENGLPEDLRQLRYAADLKIYYMQRQVTEPELRAYLDGLRSEGADLDSLSGLSGAVTRFDNIHFAKRAERLAEQAEQAASRTVQGLEHKLQRQIEADAAEKRRQAKWLEILEAAHAENDAFDLARAAALEQERQLKKRKLLDEQSKQIEEAQRLIMKTQLESWLDTDMFGPELEQARQFYEISADELANAVQSAPELWHSKLTPFIMGEESQSVSVAGVTADSPRESSTAPAGQPIKQSVYILKPVTGLSNTRPHHVPGVAMPQPKKPEAYALRLVKADGTSHEIPLKGQN